jgi:hypothetical protein
MAAVQEVEAATNLPPEAPPPLFCSRPPAKTAPAHRRKKMIQNGFKGELHPGKEKDMTHPDKYTISGGFSPECGPSWNTQLSGPPQRPFRNGDIITGKGNYCNIAGFPD